MTSSLDTLEDWAAGLLGRLEPKSRAKLARSIGQALRRSQQQRISTQKNPNGSRYTPRKERDLRGKKERLKRKTEMFQKLRRATWLTVQADESVVIVGFSGRVAKIARVHQYGLKESANRGGLDLKYEQRKVLGFTEDDLERIRVGLLNHLTLKTT